MTKNEKWICNACRTPVPIATVKTRAKTIGSDAPQKCPTCGADDGFSREKKPYVAPKVVEHESFEGRALTCVKHGGPCAAHHGNKS